LRYFSSAADGLFFNPHLKGGEPVVVLGMSARGPLQTVLPVCLLETDFVVRGERHARPCSLQTVLIEPDENRLRLTFHSELVCDRDLMFVDRIDVKLSRLAFTS
jgi:hypothetical protein